MIKLSTKGRYGTRLMLNLALHSQTGNEAVILKNIAADEEISIRYLEQIIIPLKIKRLVKSIRGAGGGYTLTRKPSQIKLLEILEALEGPICLVDCINDPDFCGRIPICSAFKIWKEASDQLKAYFDRITLQDLLEVAQTKQRKPREKTRPTSREAVPRAGR